MPREQAAAVLKALTEVRAAEAALEAKVKGGLEMSDFARAVLASDRVRHIE